MNYEESRLVLSKYGIVYNGWGMACIYDDGYVPISPVAMFDFGTGKPNEDEFIKLAEGIVAADHNNSKINDK